MQFRGYGFNHPNFRQLSKQTDNQNFCTLFAKSSRLKSPFLIRCILSFSLIKITSEPQRSWAQTWLIWQVFVVGSRRSLEINRKGDEAMRNLICSLCAILLFGFLGSAHAATITIVPNSPLEGPLLYKPGHTTGQYSYRAYDNPDNLAYVGNNPYAQAAVASSSISTSMPQYEIIHMPEYANDGYYGNGASWISNPNVNGGAGWLKIDLGITAWIDGIMFGRDRIVGYDDRDPGQFTISSALDDNIYANGNDSNDASEYSLVASSWAVSPSFDGYIDGKETILVNFEPVEARFIKMYFTNGLSGSVAIDEVEIFGAPVPEPATMLLLGTGLIGLAGARRKFRT
jgi:hypothetical protein